MRIASIGHAIFAVAMIGLGAVGLLHPDFVPLWNPVPTGVPAHELFIYFGALISLTAGIGLLVPRMAAIAARLKDGSMPCDGAWPLERVALFERWVENGTPE